MFEQTENTMEANMKAVMAKGGSEAGDNDAFKLTQQSTPAPGAQDLLVRVVAIGMNPVDTKVRQRAPAALSKTRATAWAHSNPGTGFSMRAISPVPGAIVNFI